MNYYEVWKITMWVITLIILLTIVLLITTNDWHYTLKFEMDNNTLEAVKSINWSAFPK